MRIEHLYRYPVKGLTAEALEAITVETGEAIPWDRAFALAQGDAPFDPEKPEWIRKQNFMCLAANSEIAALRSHFDAKSGVLTIRAPNWAMISENALTSEGRQRLAAWLTAFMGASARGVPTFHHVPGHVFGDQKTKVVSLINAASLADLEAKQGERRHRLRFRANVYFSGAPAWQEHEWIDRELLVGTARLRVVKRTVRCPATEVNPETAQRDANPVLELRTHFGHADLGVHAEVVDGGRFAIGDALEVL